MWWEITVQFSVGDNIIKGVSWTIMITWIWESIRGSQQGHTSKRHGYDTALKFVFILLWQELYQHSNTVTVDVLVASYRPIANSFWVESLRIIKPNTATGSPSSLQQKQKSYPAEAGLSFELSSLLAREILFM